jgi:hypothetical protein
MVTNARSASPKAVLINQGRSDFLSYPEIEEPDISPEWGHSPASN